MKFWVRWTFNLIAALTLGYILTMPGFSEDKEHSRATACLSSVKQQGMAVIMYSGDHDDRLPFRDRWIDAAKPYVSPDEVAQVFRCNLLPKGEYGYAFNAALSQAAMPKNPETIPLTYESVNPIRNASDLFTSVPTEGRHLGKNNVEYADGHAKALRSAAP